MLLSFIAKNRPFVNSEYLLYLGIFLKYHNHITLLYLGIIQSIGFLFTFLCIAVRRSECEPLMTHNMSGGPRLYIHAGLIRIGILDMDAARMLLPSCTLSRQRARLRSVPCLIMVDLS